MVNQEPELIFLQNANVQQLTRNGISGDWRVVRNISGETLYTFPPMKDSLMQGVLNFAREFELTAFNEGIKFQKTKANRLLTDKIKFLKFANAEVIDENARLATLLENLTKGD